MLRYISKSVKETENIAEKLAEKLRPGDFIAYEGSLGAGKTAFTRGLARGLGLLCDVLSPTFTIMNEYPGKIPLYHFDMFRVQGDGDLESTGFYDYAGGGGIVAVEWGENIPWAIPAGAIRISIEPIDENTRGITIEGDERF